MAAREFFRIANPEDEFFLVEFDSAPRLRVPLTSDTGQIENQLLFSKSKGSTALLDAVYMALTEMKRSKKNKKALLIISDGQDNNSRYTYKELRNRIKEADVQIYAIGITDPASDALAGFGRSVLEEITRMTGGRSFFPNAYNEPELVEICTRIALELRHQYSVGFYPTDVASEAKWHRGRPSAAR